MCCREGGEQWSRVTCGKADGEPVTSARINGIENIPDPGLIELTGNTDISGNYTLSHGGIFAALYLECGRLFAHFQFLFSQSWLGAYEEAENRQDIKYLATEILYMSITYFPFHICAVSASGSVYILASNAKFNLALQPRILVYQRLMAAFH